MEDRSVFDGSCMEPSVNETSPSCSLLNVVERVIIPSLYSHDPAFSLCAARCLLVIAPLFPACTASLVIKAVSVLATLLRNSTSFFRACKILETLAPIVPRLSKSYIPRLCALVVEAASSFPDRTDRMFLLERICRACVNEGIRPFRDPEVISALFTQPFLVPFYKDTPIRIADELTVALVHTMSEAGCCEHQSETTELEACLAFAEKTWHILTCSPADSVFAGDAWLRWITKLFTTLFDDSKESSEDKKISSLRERATKLLADMHAELPSVNNSVLAIGLIYIITCFTPTKNLSSIDNCQPFYSVLCNRFMRLEDLENWASTCETARSSGLIISSQQPRGSPYARPVPKLLQSVSHCLCTLCSRSPQLAGPIDKALEQFLTYFESDPKNKYNKYDVCYEQKNVNSLVVPVIQSTRRAIAIAAASEGKTMCRKFPHSMHLTVSPVLTLEDDFLWLGVAAARSNRAVARSSIFDPTPEVLVTGKSDIFAVTFSHILNRALNRMTLFVKVTNGTLYPQLGGSFALETPQNMLPWTRNFSTLDSKESSSTMLSESIMKLEPVCSQTLRFSMKFTRFAPTRMVGRVSVAIAKNVPAREPPPITQGRIMSISSVDMKVTPATPVHLPNTPRKQSEQRPPETPDPVEDTSKWPELFTEPYILSPFELTDPLPLHPHVFDFVWNRFPVSRVDIFVIQTLMNDPSTKMDAETFAMLSQQILEKLEKQCNMYHVGKMQWGGDRSFHSWYSFVSWFDDVFGVHVHGHHHPLENYMQISIELRSSSLPALSAISPALIQNALFADLNPSYSASYCERPYQESKPYSANVSAQVARWKSLKTEE